MPKATPRDRFQAAPACQPLGQPRLPDSSPAPSRPAARHPGATARGSLSPVRARGGFRHTGLIVAEGRGSSPAKSMVGPDCGCAAGTLLRAEGSMHRSKGRNAEGVAGLRLPLIPQALTACTATLRRPRVVGTPHAQAMGLCALMKTAGRGIPRECRNARRFA
jgi:hypothetical protein